MHRHWPVRILALGMVCQSGLLCADEASPAAPPDESPVAATVNGAPIRRAQVEAALEPATEGRQLAPEILARLAAEALDKLIDRKLVADSLSAGGKEVTAAEIDAALAKVKTQLEGQHVPLDKFLADKHLTLTALREQIAWQLLWERNMQKHLTDKVLEGYFEAHKKEFDGSEVRASHILLRPAKAGDAEALPKLVKQAGALREQIEAGQLTFADAAAKHSAGPSRARGGDVGFFPRHGVMAEPFAEAAFALEKGQISQPVVTPFGVHLIQPTDLRPGGKPWTDAREALKPPAAQALLEKLARRERDKARIEFTGAAPYFRPGTRELVLPEQQPQ